MRLATLVGCLLLTAAAPATAQNWTYARSDHFEVYTTGGDRRAREALTHFERVHAFFVDVLKLSPRTTTPTRLIIFSNERQFAPYRPNEVAAAYYLSGPDRDYIVMQSLNEEWYPVVVHEYVHLIIRHSGSVYPVWLNEGLAEFYSTMKQEGRRMRVGDLALRRLAYLGEGQPLMPLERLFAVGRDSPEYNTNAHAGLFYSQSWALTHMLLTDPRYRPQSPDFSRLVSSGVPSAAAIEQAFGRPLSIVSRDLSGYIHRDQYVLLSLDYRLPPDGARIPTRPADPFEAALVTANLLANQRDRQDDAHAAFERLSAERPDHLELLESRAYFELRRGQMQNALPFLTGAAEIGSTNPRVYRDLAIIQPERTQEHLAKALELAPEDLEIRMHYATALLNANRSGQALSTLAQVKQVPDESAFQFLQLLANTYLRLNALDEARSAATRAAERAEPGSQAAFVARMIETIDAMARVREAAASRAARAEADDTAPPDTADAPRANAVVAPAPPAPPAPPVAGAAARGQEILTTRGRIRNMVCGSEAPILEVATDAGTLRLQIDDPLAIRVMGLSGFTVDLHCGRQDVPVRIGYLPAVDSTRKTVGSVRLLDYREP